MTGHDAAAGRPLRRSDLAPEPMAQLRAWVGTAGESGVVLPSSFVLSTVDAEGRPSARSIPMRDLDSDGPVVYTDLRSRKGRDFSERPESVSALFVWLPLMRQVHIAATAELLPEEDTDRHFDRRPRASRLNAWTTRRSDVVGTRAELVAELDDIRARFEGVERVPRPDWWCAVRLRPRSVEFWQAADAGDVHDRLRYSPGARGWVIERVAP